VGDGSERSNLQKQADELGVGGDIEFVGERAHDELPDWYSKADIFVMPSLSEGFGITAIEAMAAGLAIVVTWVGSLPEIVRDGETGILVEPKRADQIHDAVLRIYNNEILRVALAESAKSEVQRFDWHHSAQKVYEVYRQLAV